jgi:hypothetical protein
MTDVRFVRVPKVIETPKLDDPEATDRRMLDRLMNFMVEGTESRVRRGRRT